MARAVLCVPNFSEGRNKDVMDSISKAISETPGCSLLDISAGESTNRSVYTFAGTPEAVVLGALNSAKVAHQLIDMSKHEGEHPAIGAMDVCPFVPISGVTMEECVQCSQEFGQQLAKELGVPVYLYEHSSDKTYRKTLPDIREGEYKGLSKKLEKPEWEPDFGPAKFVSSWGATVTGARDPLVAYNVNLLGTKQQANRIALDIREIGRGPKQPGTLKHCRAIGWYLEERDIAQVSINLTCPSVTPLHVAYEECVKQAKVLNLPVIGSEIVGLVPLQLMLAAADYYIQRDNLFIAHEHQKIMLAVDRLGLNQLGEFDANNKIIEYKMQLKKDGKLVGSTVRQFVERVAARSTTPGGGSVSACIAAMGAALGAMVGWMTYGYKKFESVDMVMRKAIPPLNDVTQKLLPLIDMDSEAYTSYVEATKLPHRTEEEKAKRNAAMDVGLKKAADVPMSIIRIANQCWPHLVSLAEHGNIACKSDLQVGCKALLTGIQGAFLNVQINLKDIKDQDYCSKIMTEANEAMQTAEKLCTEVLARLDERSTK